MKETVATVNRHIPAAEARRESRRLRILLLLFILCTLFYYFGELVDLAGWGAVHWNIFYAVHDIHRLLFLAPIIYAGYFFGARAAIIVTIIAGGTFMPRALFVSLYPDPLPRTVLFIIIAGIIGYLAGSQTERRKRLEALVRSERQAILRTLASIEEGALIIGPDYRIRFVNPGMVRDFGEGAGSDCQEYLHSFGSLREQICKVPNDMNAPVKKWEYTLSDGRTYEVVATPFLDSDNIVCQFVTFKNITRYRTA